MHKLINDRDDLYNRNEPYRRKKFDLLVCRLVQFSETDLVQNLENVIEENLQDISEQWFFTGAEIEPNSSCLCGQGKGDGEEVKYVTYIRNLFTRHIARIGSSCIKKFGDGNPIQAEVALLLPLMKNHSVRVNPDLAELMVEQKIITQLELALIKELYQKRKLEQDAIDVLSLLKARIAIEKIPPSVTDIAEWIEEFISKNPENPEFVSPYDNKKVTVSKRLIDEYRELRKKLLVADAFEYEKQTAIKILSAFYSHELNLTPEPKKERPNLDRCQLDKLQVNQCNADQIIHTAELKVENYIGSRNKNITEERETYTVLSVLLDAYHRFNSAAHNIDLLDGIQESIARLELEIEKLPSTIRESISKVEEELKLALQQNINEMESDTRRRHKILWQELQQVKDRLSHEVRNTVNDSKELLNGVEAELERLKEEKSHLVAEHTLSIQLLEESIWLTIKDRNNRVDSLERITEESQSNIEDLRREINWLEESVEENQSSIKNLSRKIDALSVNIKSIGSNLENTGKHSRVLTTAVNGAMKDIHAVREELTQVKKNSEEIGAVRRELSQAKKNSEAEWWATITWIAIAFLLLGSIFFWMIDSRLDKLEIEKEQRINSTFRQPP
ncbi:hypothetical protein H6F95_18870 [Cyanobacteria bacterium FACHB-471]|nr:hypothetical protein [Cyanobacteria bacterium FACHB-471]